MNASQGSHGSKGFVVKDGHAGCHTGQHGGRIVSTLAFDRFAPAQHLRPGCLAFLYLLLELIAQVGARHRSQLIAGVQWITHLESPGCLDKPALELIGDAVDQQKSLGRKADLARVAEPALDAGSHRLGDVGVFKHNERVGATQFHDAFLDHLAGLGRDGGARANASGYGRALDAAVVDDVDDILGAEDQVLEHAFRKAGFQHHSLQLERAALRVGRVLDEHGVARQQRGNAEARHLPKRKVPGHDAENGAERMERDVSLGAAGGRGFVGQHPGPVLRIPLGLESALFHLGLRLRKDLSHLGGDRPGEATFVLPERLRQPANEFGTLKRRRPTKALEGCFGATEYRLYLGGLVSLKRFDRFAVGRIDGVERFIAHGLPPGDQSGFVWIRPLCPPRLEPAICT